jgi:FkbM family methyltransferase
MAFVRRAVGAVSRRLGRPELVSAFYAGARQLEHESLALEAVLAASLHSDSSYVDVGCNRGQVLREAVRIAPRGRHFAFEPIPALADELAREFPEVDCRRLALGAQRETAQFCHYTCLDGWSGLRKNPEIDDERGAPEYIDVQVSTLDKELNGETPALIKIDVEGAELGVLQGAVGLIGWARPTLVFEHVPATSSLYGDEPGALWDLLSGLDYRIMSIMGQGPFERQRFVAAETIVNWLATPES